MKCCSIKLASREQDNCSFFHRNGHKCHPTILENVNDSRPDTKAEAPPEEDNRPYLSVLDIMLPKDIKAFNTGSSTARWASKRPRLKSAKLKAPQKDEHTLGADLDNLDVSNLIKELQNECGNEEGFKESEMEEIDPDIKRLLEESESDALVGNRRISFDLEDKERADEGGKRKSKRKHKKKSKEDRKDKKSKRKLTKTVSFSLSKPPTPQTEQVIRVDVVSNSVEFPMEANISEFLTSEPDKTQDGNSEKKNEPSFVFQVFCAERDGEARNFVVESKRAVLFPRGSEK